MIETEQGYCTCGLPFDKATQEAHHERQVNPTLHTFTKNPPRVEPGSLMFTIWAVEKACTSPAADILVHASLHIHLTDVISQHREPIEQLFVRREYEKRALLEAAFPYLLLTQSKSSTKLNRKQLLGALINEDYFDEIPEEDLNEVVIEWDRRH